MYCSESARYLSKKSEIGSGPMFLSNVNCTGRESDLEQCYSMKWGENLCSVFDTVYINCKPGTLCYFLFPFSLYINM